MGGISPTAQAYDGLTATQPYPSRTARHLAGLLSKFPLQRPWLIRIRLETEQFQY